MSTPAPRIETRPLTKQEEHDLMMHQAVFFKLVEVAGIETGPEDDTPQICDALMTWWHQLPQDGKVETGQFSQALGAALGEFIRHHLKFEWQRIDDAFGSFVGLFADAADQRDIVLDPANTVLKRLEEAQEGALFDYLNHIFKQFGETLKRQ